MIEPCVVLSVWEMKFRQKNVGKHSIMEYVAPVSSQVAFVNSTYLDTELVFKGSQRRGGGLLLSRSESGGGSDKGGDDGGLHFGLIVRL